MNLSDLDKEFRQMHLQLQQMVTLERNRFQIELLNYYEKTLASPHHLEPKRLLRYGYKVYSQNDEDGIIQEIFSRIGVHNRIFVEFGVSHGLECNTLYLLLSGWRGLWMDGSPKNLEFIQQKFAPYLQHGQLKAIANFITAENINELLTTHSLSTEVDLLSIDLDYNDYWVWQAINVIQPRVVIIEYNAIFRPPLSVTVEYYPQRVWNGSNYFGASLTALEKLGHQKGYCLVGCNFSGANSFFVRADLVGNHFCSPYTADNHYEPPRYFTWLPGGHRPDFGEFIEI